ncbi:unnamed protein product [Soboliphyme baturini]|uniref:EF-hand domain-containing protein n=1 Tax=Soboliphyme baturini TaxID=241478 RepID=A0A183IQC6_9BILA|nr:unnamed protein product [Soboliphyme baturini]
MDGLLQPISVAEIVGALGRDGALGIPDLNELVTRYNIFNRAETTDDSLVAALVLTPYIQKEIKKCDQENEESSSGICGVISGLRA